MCNLTRWKPFHFFFLTAFSTFIVGIVLAGLWHASPQRPEVSEASLSDAQKQPSTEETLPEEIKLTFEDAWLVDSEVVGTTPVARFRVFNGLRVPLHYYGYTQDGHCAYRFRIRGVLAKQLSLCTCGTGLGEYTLPAGKSQVFELSLPNQAQGEFEAELEFAIGQERRKEKVRARGTAPLRQKP